MDQVDFLVAGGGVAGLAATAVLGAAGFSVLCVDPAAPVTEGRARGADQRTTAFLQPARGLLDQAGVWTGLAPHAVPLQVMRIVDAGGADGRPRVSRDFEAAELGPAPFGWNLPNWLLRREMLARIAALDGAGFRAGVGFDGMVARDARAIVRLTDGTRVAARLVIGGDGRASAVRQAAGIGVRTIRYGQKAMVFAVTHAAPHGNTSTEVHRSGGPFTLVPLPDIDGRPASSVVWMDDGPAIAALSALDDAAFGAAATRRSGLVMGPLTVASPRQVWPVISQMALALTAPRVALMAEAAHVLPPIGAQGLNMSLADLAVLTELARARPDEIGAPAWLAAYARRRHPGIALRVAGIDALNRVSIAGARPLRDLRAAGLRLLGDVPPVRRALMRLGLGL